MKADPNVNIISGPYGTAERIPIPDGPRSAQTTCWWLLTAPAYHPLWSQYCLLVVRLDDDVPGFPPPKRRFPGATHELLVMAMEPQEKPHTVESMTPGPLLYLEPVNIIEQFIAADDEMRELAQLSAMGVVHGALNPETSDAPTHVRNVWLTSLVRTLAHIRGEEHAP